MIKNNVYILEDRGLLYINGDNAKEFLQNNSKRRFNFEYGSW